jgi:F-type H+-transporting ATPase subunit b
MRANFDSLGSVAPKGIAAAIVAGLGAVVSTSVMAASAPGEAKLPQLDIQTYPSQIFWLVVTFIVLYVIVSKVAVPRISEVLGEREERIADDLDKAETLKKEAEQVRAEYEKALTEARDKAHSATREAQEAAAKSGALAETEAQAKVVAMLKTAEARIAAARTEALGNVRSVARDVAGDAVSKLIGVEVDSARIDGVIDAAMEGRS